MKNTEDIVIFKMEVSTIKHMLREKVDIDDFATLEKRVAMLERKR
jgi:hypothetical protein